MTTYRPAFNPKEYDSRIKATLPYYEEFYRQAAETARIFCAGKLSWLDVGCGTGKMAEAALAAVPLERFVFCDRFDEMIFGVKERFDFPGAEFLTASAESLDFTEEFDVVTSILVFHYLQKEERAKAIGKCFQALKPGGIFITFENFRPEKGPAEELYLSRWEDYQRRMGKSPREAAEHIGRYQKDYFPISLQEHRELLTQCGFRSAELLWLSYMQAGFLAIR